MKKKLKTSSVNITREKIACLINIIKDHGAILQEKKITAGFDGFIDTNCKTKTKLASFTKHYLIRVPKKIFSTKEKRSLNIGIHTLVLHSAKEVVVFTNEETVTVGTFFIPNPKISTRCRRQF